jgi:hypothetical protein
MANVKKYDLAVKTGTYIKNGEEKGRYESVGAIWEGDKGVYMVMKRTFNPAGVPFKDGSDSIFLSMFEPKEEQREQGNSSKAMPGEPSHSIDDDIPFQSW